jgi:hypothetical protein
MKPPRTYRDGGIPFVLLRYTSNHLYSLGFKLYNTQRRKGIDPRNGGPGDLALFVLLYIYRRQECSGWT